MSVERSGGESRSQVRDRIVELVAEAEAAIPNGQVPDPQPSEWHPFEHTIWARGELIRQEILKQKGLREDRGLQEAFGRVACNRMARRGRQSFVLLLGFKCCAAQAPGIAGQLDDPDVAGHAVDTLLKMRVPVYTRQIQPLTSAEAAWVRKKAKQYVARYGAG